MRDAAETAPHEKAGGRRQPRGSLASLAETMHENGYVFMAQYDPETAGHEVADAIGVRIPGQLGRLHVITPSPADTAIPNTYSGRYGYDGFPLHTDLAQHREPPKFLMLRCVRGHSEVQTTLMDGYEIVASVGSSVLSRTLVQPRRPINGKRALLAIWDRHAGRGRVRWDEEYLRAASSGGAEGMARMRKEIQHAVAIPIALHRRGDTLLIDNWRMLHGRSDVPTACRNRVIERVYLETVN